MWKIFFVICALVISIDSKKEGWALVGNPLAFFKPCGNDYVTLIFEQGLPPGEENQYLLQIREQFVPQSKMLIYFDSDATVTLKNDSAARIRPWDKYFEIKFFKASGHLFLTVKGPVNGAVPYLKSVVINTVEYCDKPTTGYLDDIIIGKKNEAELALTANPDESCGRRKVQHTELIVNGAPTKAGDWPWHVAIYRFENSRIDYICGGTLLSAYFVLTAAHCVTSKGLVVLPETRNVVLGKYNLVGGDIASQEKEVHKIIVHEGFEAKTLNRDIALMKFKTAAEFTDYIQPACLWQADDYKKLPQNQFFGTVIGWGFDQTDSLSLTLQQVVVPKVSDTTCIKSNPVFFSKNLDGTRFCAGYANGTSVCNGDSGGGFHVFIPDVAGNTAHDATGSWHVRGIVSLTVRRRDAPICDPESYALFTDLAKYKGWIKNHMATG